jgi:hypothetical protein
MTNVEELQAEWDAALADAGIDRSAVRLYVIEDVKRDDGAGAVWFRPGSEIGEGDQIHNPDYLRDMNKPAHKDLHRIVLWAAVETPVLAGRLRHELEHARQWDRFGQPICDLYDLVLDEVLPHKAGGLDGYQRIRARRGHQVAVVAAARKLACLFWCMLTRGEDYTFQQPSLTRKKLRRLELTAGAERGQVKPGI